MYNRFLAFDCGATLGRIRGRGPRRRRGRGREATVWDTLPK